MQGFLKNEVKTEASVAEVKKLEEKAQSTSLVVTKLGDWIEKREIMIKKKDLKTDVYTEAISLERKERYKEN